MRVKASINENTIKISASEFPNQLMPLRTVLRKGEPSVNKRKARQPDNLKVVFMLKSSPDPIRIIGHHNDFIATRGKRVSEVQREVLNSTHVGRVLR